MNALTVILLLIVVAGGAYQIAGTPEKRVKILALVAQLRSRVEQLLRKPANIANDVKSASKAKATAAASSIADNKFTNFLRAGSGRWIAIGLVIVLAIGGSIFGSIRDAELEATAKVHESELRSIAQGIAEQDEIRRLTALDEETLASASLKIEAGNLRYTESKSYGNAESRGLLLDAVAALQLILDSVTTTQREPGQLTEELNAAFAAIDNNINLVGTKEEALSAAYLAYAEKLGVSNPSVSDGIAYCDEITATVGKKSKRKIAIQMWNGISANDQYWSGGFLNDLTREAQVAVKVVCPKYKSAWKLATRIFDAGSYVVGEDIKPGRYKTIEGVRDCYWERNTGSGRIIDNYFGSAYKGVTVTLRRGEGFEANEGCGAWMPN